MTSKALDKLECPSHHLYKRNTDGNTIECMRCGRIKCVKDGGEWKVLY
jgi:hypothetical protein